MKLREKILIWLVIILTLIIIVLVLGILGAIKYDAHKANRANDILEEQVYKDAYIDIWRDLTFEADIQIVSTGTGMNKKIYTGHKPEHYIIKENGDLYIYEESAFFNAITKKNDPDSSSYIRKLCKSDLEKLEDEIKEIIKNKPLDSKKGFTLSSTTYFIKMNEETIKVDSDVYTDILEKYFDNNYQEKVLKRELTESLYEFIIKEYDKDELYPDTSESYSLTDEVLDKIVKDYREKNPNIIFLDTDLRNIIFDLNYRIKNELF